MLADRPDQSLAPRSKMRSRGCCFTVLPLLLTVSGLLAVALGLFWYREYSAWRESFIQSRNLFVYQPDDATKLRESVKGKAKDFSEAEEQVYFIELTPEESLLLLHDGISQSLPDGWSIEQLAVKTGELRWQLAMKLNVHGFELPFILFSVRKDDFESAELYIDQILLGGVDIEGLGGKQLIDKLNMGYSSALSEINGGGFTGRSFENIELESEILIIKGSR